MAMKNAEGWTREGLRMLRTTVTTTAALLIGLTGALPTQACASTDQDRDGRVSSDARPAPKPDDPTEEARGDGAFPKGGRISVQNGLFSGTVPDGMYADAWTISGGAILAGKGKSTSWFIAQTEDAIHRQLDRYKQRNGISETFEGLVVLDIEHPVHPQDWGDHMVASGSSGQFEQLMDAVKRRIEVAREEFPKAKLALYGIGMPDSRGRRTDPGYLRSMEGYHAAGRLGVYDKLDFVVPVLYQRFGPRDMAYDTIAAYTQLGVESGREMRRSNGSSVEIIPFLGLIVANGNSVHHHQPIETKDLVGQLKVMQDLGVERWAFWVGSGDPDQLDRPVSVIVQEVVDQLGDK